MNFYFSVFIGSFIFLSYIFDSNTNKAIYNNEDYILSDTVRPDTSIKSKDSLSWIDNIVETLLRKYVIKYTKQVDKPILSDTLKMIDLSKENIDTIKAEQTRKIRNKSTYNVAVVLPFMTSAYGGKEIPAHSVRAVEFYEGVEIAFDSLRKEGVNLKVSVFDSKKDSAGIADVIEKMNGTEWDLIIGPAHTEVLIQLAVYAKEIEVPLVSPFNTNPEICEDNHYFIQVNPSYEVVSKHIVALMTKAKATNPWIKRYKYLIIGTSEDSLKMEQIQKVYSSFENSDAEILPKLITNEGIHAGTIMKYLDRGALNIIVIANDKNEQFIYSCLREISTMYDKTDKSKGYQLLVVGEPSWKYLERINFEYYDNLRLHIPDNYFIDKEADKNKIFEEEFRKRYGIAPREFAYIGFDVMLYFGRLLKKYGTAFPDYFEQEIRTGRSTKFNFVPVIKNNKAMDAENISDSKRIERFENNYLNIIKFEEFEFKNSGIKID
jgi:hypothetical protein